MLYIPQVMPDFNKETLKKLTELCRIRSSDEELDQLMNELRKLLDYVDQLQEVDTKDVAPLNLVLSNTQNVMRDDVIGETLQRDAFLDNAPDQIAGLIRVPSVIKKQN